MGRVSQEVKVGATHACERVAWRGEKERNERERGQFRPNAAAKEGV